LQRVLNSAARIVSNMRKFDRKLTYFRRSQLATLAGRCRPGSVYRVCVQVFRCLNKMAPEYLSTYCQPVSGISGRRHLRSADRGHLNFPRVKLASYGGRSFAYTLALRIGTHFLLTLETVVFLFHLLSTTSNVSLLFLLARLAHAACLVFFTITRYINSLLSNIL